MFDPTAFDNLKVVLEGAIYDADLGGAITVIDRKDLVDLAAMSRSYQNTFQLKEGKKAASAEFHLVMNVSQLSGELLKTAAVPGCEVILFFHVRTPENKTYIKSIVEDLWGAHQAVTHRISYGVPFEVYHHTFEVQFNRLIGEEQIDDLIAMADHAIDTLEKIDEGAK
ncbi:hypothetical protein [Peribacillus frigoritolerans]|uniref:hypothetical protein n=1 Tax=Peribacillus frigoritolerans TaxID=450367 RepID=UPI00105A5C8A|nr:hypothetical protein [Peribacillus frigoritolerans]TDL82668.1 hypothetical protein E2R53_03615 [Peribacillus frigoritolerans]